MATTTTTPESGAAAGVVGQSGEGTEGQGGTHAAEMLSPVFLFFFKVCGLASVRGPGSRPDYIWHG